MPSDPPTVQPNELVTERERFDSEIAFRDRKLIVREKEVELKNLKYSRFWLANPLAVAILAAALASAGNILVAYKNANSAIESLDRKAEADRILEAVKGEIDEPARVHRLQFLERMKLVTDKGLVAATAEFVNTFVAQGNPPPVSNLPICKTGIKKSFSFSSKSTLDGNGNTIGIIAPMIVELYQECGSEKPGPFHFTASYNFYNGSGTQGGRQTVSLIFKSESGAVIQPVTFPLDRDKCIYGSSESRRTDGTLSADGKLITSVTIDVSRLQGIQTPC